jgi:ribonuclease HII
MKKERVKKKNKLGFVFGLDEAGRGPLAGPVVAAAVLVNPRLKIPGIKDSKKLSAKKRQEFYALVNKSLDIQWAVAKVSEKTIDQINILEATKLAMRKAVVLLIKKANKKPKKILIDGNFKIGSGFKEIPVIKGDQKIVSCMIAGIMAKVHRDRIMTKFSLQYPKYDFSGNKGYGTLAHRKAIKKHGQCPIHRKSFRM